MCLQDAREWLDLFASYSNMESVIFKSLPNFTFGNVYRRNNRLIAKQINGKQFLISPDFKVIEEDGEEGTIDFSQVNKLHGVFFDYNEYENVWVMKNFNPYLRFVE